MFNAEDFPSPAAAAALTTQIEEMNPNAVRLEVAGFRFQVAQYLAQATAAGSADISELRSHGLGSKAAIAICTAIAARHARKAAALAALTAPPAPLPPLSLPPEPAHGEADRLAALSLLHDLYEQVATGRGDVTVLCRAGFSESTAKELAAVINATRRI